MIKVLLNIAQISNNNSGIPAQAGGFHGTGDYADGTVGPPTRWNCFLFLNFQSE